MFGFNLNKETQKVNKSWNQFTVSSILTKNEQNSLSVKTMLRIVSFDCFFGRIVKIINCFRDLLNFRRVEVEAG